MEKIRASQISLKALNIRKKYLGARPHQPICPYSLCEAIGLDLLFVNIPSFEGMYVANQNLVLISSERPEGRKRFTCAHELGHHVLGHGTNIDEILENGSNQEEEKEADYFAGMLLMPSSSLRRVLKRYDILSTNLTPKDVYIISKYFGVSYQALITHAHWNLKLINYPHYQQLKQASLEVIRYSISGLKTKNQVFDIGQWWDEKAIELEVGDLIVSETKLSVDGPNTLRVIQSSDKYIYEAITSGITRIFNNDWSCFVKSSRFKYRGFYQFKYDEEEA